MAIDIILKIFLVAWTATTFTMVLMRMVLGRNRYLAHKNTDYAAWASVAITHVIVIALWLQWLMA